MVPLSSDKCTYWKSFWIKAPERPKCKYKCKRVLCFWTDVLRGETWTEIDVPADLVVIPG